MVCKIKNIKIKLRAHQK